MRKISRTIALSLFSFAALFATAANTSAGNEYAAGNCAAYTAEPAEGVPAMCSLPSYMNIFPNSPIFMLSLNLEKILDDSDILENRNAMKFIEKNSEKLPRYAKEALNAFIKNPEAAGIDLEKPAVAAFYKGMQKELVVSIPVADRKMMVGFFSPFLNDAGVVIKQVDGYYYLGNKQGKISERVVFDDNKLVISVGKPVSYYLQYSGQKAVDNSNYKKFFKSDSDVAAVVEPALWADKFMSNNDPNFKQFLNIFKNTSYISTLDFEEGELSWKNLYINIPKQHEKAFKFVKNGNGKLLKYMPENSLCVMNFNLDMNSFIKLLPLCEPSLKNADEVYKMLEKEGIDRKTINEFCTDYAVAVLPAERVGRNNALRFVVAIDCADKKIYDKFINKIKTNRKQVHPGVYAMGFNKYLECTDTYCKDTVAGFDYYLTYRNGTILLMPEDVYNSGLSSKGLSRNALNNPIYREYKDKAFVLDYKALSEELMYGKLKFDDGLVKGVYLVNSLLSVESGVIDVKSPLDSEISININSEENTLKVLIDILFNILVLAN